MSPLFVYGSLKEGFPNAHVNTGVRRPGRFRTVERLPFYLVGDGWLPCLVHAPGQGEQVIGQVFDVTADALAAMDLLERVGEPGGYVRLSIRVEPADSETGPAIDAFVYLQDPQRLQGDGPRIGPLAEYTLEHARRLAW
ncbi:MAG: gamma-glutamylcyclotransferase family protein [Aquabacterium sp.]